MSLRIATALTASAALCVLAAGPARGTRAEPARTSDAARASLLQPGCPRDAAQKVGTPGADTIVGSSLGSDVIFGLAGDHFLAGGAGRDCLYGGDGDDRLLGGRGLDRLYGGPGADRLDGEDGMGDALAGAAAHEGHGGDRLFGEAGKDRLTDVRGSALLSGGAGNDRIDSRDASRRDRRVADTVLCGTGDDVVIADEADKVAADCEHVTRRKTPRRR